MKKFMRKFNLFILLSMFWNITFSQQIVWQQHIGDTNSTEWSYAVIKSSDQNFYLTGLNGQLGFGQENILLSKLNSNGDTIWKKNIGYEGTGEFARSILESNDGLYVLGYTESIGAGAADMYLVKTDKNGNVIWEKTYGGNANDDGIDMVKLNDKYILLGNKYDLNNFQYDIYLVAINSSGDTLWTKTLGTESDDFATNLRLGNNQEILITGYTFGNNADFMDAMFIKLDTSGNVIFQQTYDGAALGENSGDFATDIIEKSNGDYLLLATENYIYQTSFTGNLWLLHLDANGDTLTTKSIIHDDPIITNEITNKGNKFIAVANTLNAMDEENPILFVFNDNLDTINSLLLYNTNQTHSNAFVSDTNYLYITGYQYNLYKAYEAYIAKINIQNVSAGINSKSKNKIQIHPNPSSDYIIVDSNKWKIYQIINVEGKILDKGNISKERININHLSSGKYFIQLMNHDEVAIADMIIVK